MWRLFILSIGLIIFGICFILTFINEKYKEHFIIKGRIIEIIKSNSPNPKYYGYTPIIEYQYDNKTYQVEHRITTANKNHKYKVNDIVELRVYKDKPDKALINSKVNLLLPFIIGLPLIIVGSLMLIMSICFK